jgi:hypothetical protein
MLSPTEYLATMATVQQKLHQTGYDGSLLEGNDILLALDPEGKIVRDKEDDFEARVCNFELIKKL